MDPNDDPIAWFLSLHASAAETESFEPDRAALARADEAGRPSVRFVLVRGVDDDGFVFFTHYGSRKAAELERGYAALAYHWSSTGVQVRVEGRVERVSAAESDAYFAGRPRGSRIGAWASPQSREIETREELERAVARIASEHEGGAVPRPVFWGGYRIHPVSIEFWFARESRLHDRFEYTRSSVDAPWTVRRLAP